MTQATSGSSQINAPSASTAAEKTLKTAFDCDILTLAKDAKLHATKAQHKAIGARDPMDALYRPLGSKDVRGALTATSGRQS
ncbi:MAG: hypothetical protein Rhims3KO_01550 [Hyphomicrobiales bacterium]